MQQAANALGHETRLPAPDRRLAFAGLPLDRHRADPIGTRQNDPSPPHMLLRAVPRPSTGRSPGGGASYDLPLSLTIGDEVLIKGTGAYTTTYCAVAFNGFAPLQSYAI